MQPTIKKKSENRRGSGVPWAPVGSLGNAPCGGSRLEAVLPEAPGFDVLKA